MDDTYFREHADIEKYPSTEEVRVESVQQTYPDPKAERRYGYFDLS